MEQLLPNGVGLLTIRYAFFKLDNHKKVIEKCGHVYDEGKSYHRNCVDFYNNMQIDNKLCELWEAMQEEIR